VNSAARVVGINTAIIAMAQGIGFSIPGTTARWVVSQILTHGRVRRGFLGIAGRQRPLDRRIVRYHRLEKNHAVEVLTVEPCSPAEHGGLRVNDLIVAINQVDVESVDDLHRFLAEWPIGRPVELDVILEFIGAKGLQLEVVTQTHAHPDHISGHQPLIKHTGARHLNSEALSKLNELVLDGQKINVYQTPGHTEDSVVFYTAGYLLTGDTLFNGNVGNCFSGDMDRFFESIKMILAFPDKTRIYAGHDYVIYSMSVARLIDPDNPKIDSFLQKYDPKCVYSSLAEERMINPYLRFNDPAIVSNLKEKALPHATEYERWVSIMSLP
jgi:hydroxyacylglutathione hydrolase